MNRKLFFVMVVFAAILLPMILVGQEKKDSGGVSVTGCFNKGADADHYVLKDEKGKEYVVTGDAGMLARHANNHRVTITGNKPIAFFKLSNGTGRVLCAGAIVLMLRLSSVTFRYRSIPYSGVRAGSIGLSPGGGL